MKNEGKSYLYALIVASYWTTLKNKQFLNRIIMSEYLTCTCRSTSELPTCIVLKCEWRQLQSIYDNAVRLVNSSILRDFSRLAKPPDTFGGPRIFLLNGYWGRFPGVKAVLTWNWHLHLVPSLAVLWLRRLVAGFSPRSSGFDSRVGPCVICDRQSGSRTGFSPSTSVFPCQFHSIGAPLKKNWSSSSQGCTISLKAAVRP
jgi:hypothetical protein